MEHDTTKIVHRLTIFCSSPSFSCDVLLCHLLSSRPPSSGHVIHTVMLLPILGYHVGEDEKLPNVLHRVTGTRMGSAPYDGKHLKFISSLSRWTTDACNSSSTRCRPADESTASELALTLQHMVKGRTKEALSAAVAAVAYSQCPGITSLESLVIFAANPIPLEAIRKRMLHREMGAKVNAADYKINNFYHGLKTLLPAAPQNE